ncbi:MAG: peptide chain release factor N(5)-glutamine methyltransferase [Patescibacteria group bacterium]|mgnify:CR=1 FL=1
MITLSEALRHARGVLPHQSEAEILLATLLKADRSFLIAHPEHEVSDELERDFLNCVERRAAGEPVAYILRKKEFFGLEFEVDSRCLIPRPETELVVETALEYIDMKAETSTPVRTLLDVGTGSGAIAVTLAKRVPLLHVTATDISSDALCVASANANKNEVGGRVEILQSDLLSAVSSRTFDIIVANLPYIGTEHFNFVEKEVAKFEPQVALFGGKDGLELYRKLFEQVKKLTNLPRMLLGEFGFLQREVLESILNEYFGSNAKISFRQDMALLDRIFIVDFEYA